MWNYLVVFCYFCFQVGICLIYIVLLVLLLVQSDYSQSGIVRFFVGMVCYCQLRFVESRMLVVSQGFCLNVYCKICSQAVGSFRKGVFWRSKVVINLVLEKLNKDKLFVDLEKRRQ